MTFPEFQRAGSVQLLSRVQIFATPWAAACQIFLSITNSSEGRQKEQVQTVANQGTMEGTQKQKKNNQLKSLKQDSGSSSRNIHNNIFKCFCRTKAFTQAFPTTQALPTTQVVTSEWAQDSPSITLLPHHQQIRRKSHILQPSPQILPKETYFPK